MTGCFFIIIDLLVDWLIDWILHISYRLLRRSSHHESFYTKQSQKQAYIDISKRIHDNK